MSRAITINYIVFRRQCTKTDNAQSARRDQTGWLYTPLCMLIDLKRQTRARLCVGPSYDKPYSAIFDFLCAYRLNEFILWRRGEKFSKFINLAMINRTIVNFHEFVSRETIVFPLRTIM